MRTKLKALTADIYRVRMHKSRWNVYRTARGWVLNTGKTYRYYNTGLPFHKTAKAVVDIRGKVSVETSYAPGYRIMYSTEIFASGRTIRRRHA
jgi:hypothetical protein